MHGSSSAPLVYVLYFENRSDILLLCSLIIENKETKIVISRTLWGCPGQEGEQLEESKACMVPGA